MNILICDDRRKEADALAVLLHDSGRTVHTTVFDDGYDALEHIHSGANIDVCFLDIIMPVISGVALAKTLRKEGFTGKIVFISTSSEYAPESYEVKAFSYLLKPPTPESVKKLLNELELSNKAADTSSILLKVPGAARSVLLRDISHVEVILRKVFFRLTDGSAIEVPSTLNQIAPKLLSDPRFIQCHRSFIVNMDDISEISKREIIMRSKKSIPISKGNRDTMKIYFTRMFGDNKIETKEN